MKKEAAWKRELKEVFAISSVFFVIFVLFLFMKKSILDDYSVDFYILGTALVGSLIIAKVVLIFDLLPLSKRMDHFANIYRVIFRSLVYILGFVLFSLLEHLLKGLIHHESFSHAFSGSLKKLGTANFLTSMSGVFVAFLFFNVFWVIRAKYGAAELYKLFFNKKH